MKIERLFRVIVVTGASSTVGIAACGGTDNGTDNTNTDVTNGSSGAATSTGGASSAGAKGNGGATGSSGATGNGGAIGNGGANGDGGATSTGGAKGNGGATSTGGAKGNGGTLGSGGKPSTGGVPNTGGVASTGGKPSSGGAPASCDTVCHPNPADSTWTICNGCCCWLPVTFAGVQDPSGPICGPETCCTGRGR